MIQRGIMPQIQRASEEIPVCSTYQNHLKLRRMSMPARPSLLWSDQPQSLVAKASTSDIMWHQCISFWISKAARSTGVDSWLLRQTLAHSVNWNSLHILAGSFSFLVVTTSKVTMSLQQQEWYLRHKWVNWQATSETFAFVHWGKTKC